jgi:hypothetical protein
MRILQKIGGFISIFSNYTQKINVYPNEDIINSLLKEKFKEIEKLIFEEEFEKAESIVDDLLTKQENLNEEFYLEGYKIELILIDGKNRNVDHYMKSFKKKSLDNSKLAEWLYKFAIASKDINYFDEAKKIWQKQMEDKKILFSKEVEISLAISNYDNMMNLEDNLNEFGTDREFYYFSIMYLNISNLDKANQYIKKALNLNKTDYAVYIETLISLNNIFMKRRYKAQINKDEKKILEKSLIKLSEIDCSKINLAFKKELSSTILNIKLLLDKKEAISYFDNLDNKVKSYTNIQFLRAIIYELENKFDKAYEIYNFIISNNKTEQIVERIIFTLFQLQENEKVIFYYNEYIEFTGNKEELSLFYFISMNNLYKTEEVYKKLELKKNTISEFVYWFILAIINENSKEKCIQFLENCSLTLGKCSYLRLSVAQQYRRFNEYDKALELIEDMSKSQKEVYREFIIISLESKQKKWLDKCENFWIDYYSDTEDFDVIGLVYYVLCHLNQNRKALILSEMLYNKYNTIRWLFEFVNMRVLNNKLRNIEPLLSNLSFANDNKSLILCAYTYMKLGEKDKAWKIAYRVMIKLKQFNYEIYKNVVAIFFNYVTLENNNFDIEESSIEYPVKMNDTVTLMNEEGNIVKICLNEELEFRDNSIIYESLNINVDNELWYSLLGSKKNDEVAYKGEVYKIVDIRPKYIEMASFCFKAILEEQTEIKEIKKEEYFRQFSIQDNDFSEIIEFMKKDRERYKYLIDTYNHKNKDIPYGLPIYLLLRDKEALPKLIDTFKYNKEYVFFSGTPNMTKNKNYVLTYTSVVLLEKLDILKYINDTSTIQVTSGLIDEIKEIVTKLESNFNKKSCSLFITDDDRLLPYEKNKEEKVSELRFWNSILKFINKCNIVNDISILDNKLLSLPSEWILYSDLEAISLSVRDNSMLIMEDMFIRTVIQSIYANVEISNSYPIVESVKYNNFNKFYKTLTELIELKYFVTIDEREFFNLYLNYSLLNGSFSGFDKLVKLMIKNDIGNVYKNILYNIFMYVRGNEL